MSSLLQQQSLSSLTKQVNIHTHAPELAGLLLLNSALSNQFSLFEQLNKADGVQVEEEGGSELGAVLS